MTFPDPAVSFFNSPDQPPAMRGPGKTSAPVLAFLDTGKTIVAEFWQSSLEGQPPKWFVSEETYHLERPYTEISDTVVGWREIEKIHYLRNLLA